MSKQKLSIGAFSKMMQVTIKTLRHYEQLGLLLPDEVDEWTGYRYYRVPQMQKLNAIRELKALGFSLEEIKELWEDDLHVPTSDQLDKKLRSCNQELETLLKRRKHLLQLRDARKQINQMEKFNIQSLPSIIVASHREIIRSYDDLGPLCVNVIGPEMQRLGCQCTTPGYCFTFSHDQEYHPTNIDIEYCEQVVKMGTDSDIIQFKQLPAVEKALCMKHVGPYDKFYESFSEAFRYLEEQGYHIVGHPRFSYIDGAWNQEDPEKWLSIIQIPIGR